MGSANAQQHLLLRQAQPHDSSLISVLQIWHVAECWQQRHIFLPELAQPDLPAPDRIPHGQVPSELARTQKQFCRGNVMQILTLPWLLLVEILLGSSTRRPG